MYVQDRLHQSKGTIIDYYLRAYEQAHGEVAKLKHQYLAKTRRADEAEDEYVPCHITAPTLD